MNERDREFVEEMRSSSDTYIQDLLDIIDGQHAKEWLTLCRTLVTGLQLIEAEALKSLKGQLCKGNSKPTR